MSAACCQWIELPRSEPAHIFEKGHEMAINDLDGMLDCRPEPAERISQSRLLIRESPRVE